ncbi:cytochrome d ubiquinol oxidase subunit II [Oenococcus alcoholitolerans]|uniref:cytochrome d ubiquinol oxidase subunit II n=1 Tax=Oenococcus alcoholitolerans TaxID=931074 RepID=UPI003F72EB23
MSFLQILWFVVIAILFAAFIFFEGFDFGVGMATRFLAETDDQRKEMLSAVAPHWDGNEVWLITAGGAMFASFPMWYASLFSGFYILLFLTLVALILRGVSFEFQANAQTKRESSLWLWANFIGCFFAPLFLGIMLTAMIQTLPIDKTGNLWLSFFNVINPLSVVGGLAVVYICYIHGLNFLSLKTKGSMHYRSLNVSEKLYWPLYPALVLFAILAIFQTDFFSRNLPLSVILILLIVISAIWGHLSLIKYRAGKAFMASGSTLVLIIAFIFSGLFPRLLIARNPSNDLLVSNSSASNLTLMIMTGVLVVLLPIVIAYMSWSYFLQRKHFVDDQNDTQEQGY